MSLRVLFGPELLISERLPESCCDGQVAAFSADSFLRATSWESFTEAAIPKGFTPDLLAVDLSYHVLPSWLRSVPVPTVGLAGDASLLWHGYKHLDGIDLLLCDTESADRFQRAGMTPARAAILYGAEQVFFDDLAGAEGERDIDVLFVGNLHPAIQAERLPWLQRIARFRERWNVQILTDAWGADYRELLRRSRIVFNRSARSEWNRRSSETLIAGALLLTEHDNREVPALLRDRVECVFYDDASLETLLEYYLTHEEERQAIAKAGQCRAREFSFEAQWKKALASVAEELPELKKQTASRPVEDPVGSLVSRVWRASSAHQSADAALVHDLQQAVAGDPKNAALHNALGVALALATREGGRVSVSCASGAAKHFHEAVVHDSRHLPAALNLAESLVGVGQQALAVETARRALVSLDRDPATVPSWLDAPHFPPALDLFTVGWQKAGWDHAGNPSAEARTKRDLLRWRFHTLLAALTGELPYYHEAVNARPGLPAARAALGCALAREQRVDLAVPHLRVAVAGNPFDGEAARALYQALLDTGNEEGARSLARDQGLLRQSAPTVVPAEPWHLRLDPTATESGLRVETLNSEDFADRYGVVDTSRAVHSYTPPRDAHVVLTLLAHLRPSRILEIGTAAGHMTANLTEWSPDEATIFTLGTTAEMQDTCSSEQHREAPPPEVLGRFADHFGKLDKVQFIRADSLRYNFARLAPLDFAFIDGAHDLEHVLSDTRNVYKALRPGGCMVWHDFGSATSWVQVREAIEQANLPEAVQHVEGTEVAFLIKGAVLKEVEPPSSLPTLRWEGGIAGLHSLALVNRELCQRFFTATWNFRSYPSRCTRPWACPNSRCRAN